MGNESRKRVYRHKVKCSIFNSQIQSDYTTVHSNRYHKGLKVMYTPVWEQRLGQVQPPAGQGPGVPAAYAEWSGSLCLLWWAGSRVFCSDTRGRSTRWVVEEASWDGSHSTMWPLSQEITGAPWCGRGQSRSLGVQAKRITSWETSKRPLYCKTDSNDIVKSIESNEEHVWK